MTSLVKISGQTLWQILGKAVSSLSTFIILGIVARSFGAEGTGVFTLTLVYLGIFYMLADFGFNAHVLKSGRDDWRKLLGTRLIWSLFLVLISLVLLFLLPFRNPDFSKAVLIGSAAIIFSAIFTTSNLIFQSRLRYDLSVLASSAGSLTSLLIFIYLSGQKPPVSYLLFAHLSAWVLTALTALLLVRKYTSSLSPVFNWVYSLSLIRNTWPIAATLALNVIYFRADSFLVAYFRSTAEAGIYNAAYSVFQSALVLPVFTMNAYYPFMLKSLAKVKLVGLGLLAVSLAGTVLTYAASPFIIQLLTGNGFEGSVRSLQILSLGFPAYFVSALLMWMLIAKNKYKTMFLIYTSGLIFNLAANFIYIPQYSFIAASWITVISEYLILTVQAVVLLRSRL